MDLEPFGELDDRFVQIAAVGREQLLLLRHRLHDPWVAVPGHGHVVVAVEVPPVVGVEQPDTLAADEVHRAGVEQRRSGQRPTTALEQGTGGRPSVGEPAAGLAETPRDCVYPRRLDGIEEGAGPRLAARGVCGVVRVEPAPPGGDSDLSGKPGRDQIREQRGLLVFERRHRDVAADDRAGRLDGVVTAVEHIGDGDGKIADQRRMGHIPEVHDPADPKVIAEQHVVQAHIAVDHLRAKPGQRRRDPGLEPVQNRFHLNPAVVAADMGEQRPQLGQAGDIPQDLVVGRGVEKATQRPSQPGRDLPMGPDRLSGERRVRGYLPGQEREKPGRVGPAVGPRHLDPGFPRRRQGSITGRARITGRPGSTRSMWRRAAACIARMGPSSAGLEILNKKRCPAAVSTRKFWSRSPARGLRDDDSTPKPSRRICLAACSPKAGGGLSKGSGRFTIGPKVILRPAGRPPPGRAAAWPRCRLAELPPGRAPPGRRRLPAGRGSGIQPG